MTDVSIVTLLFTDLVGSTAQLERLGDDAAEQLRRTHFRLLRDAVAMHGGQEVKNLGDGLMVVFPSAVDAVGCAVAMQQAVHRHNERQAEHRLAVRVGLHVGEPIRDEADYFGKPVVIAKRLCDCAQGSQIVASDLVHSLVGTRGDYTFRDLGPLTLKGITEPHPACEVVWGPAEAPRVPLPPWLTAAEWTAFVGRTEDMARLRDAWDGVRAGQRRMVFVAGEPGIGKTRLALEFARAVHADGATVLFGRSSEETLIPYQPFVEGLQHYITACPLQVLWAQVGRHSGELNRLVPELAERVPDLPPPVRGDPEGERYRLFEAVAALLASAGKVAPVLVVLDDLHWADKPTLLLLKHLLRAPEPAPLLVLGAYRETELGRTHPLAETLADLRRDQVFDRLLLSGLDEEDVNVLVSTLAGHEILAAFTQAVHAQTEGNPFFVGEVLRHLAESGVIAQWEGRWRSELPLDRLGIPEGVKEVIGHRLSRLSDACNQVLGIAAVIGREFDLSVLEQVSELSGDRLLDVLEDAVTAAIIAEVPGVVGRYSFVHALIRETLYGELTTTRRVRLHRRIGEALERIAGANVEPYLAALAYHFLEAAPGGDVDKGIKYSTHAGERATRLLAYEEAAGHYERALEGLGRKEPRDDGRRCELLLTLGETLSRAGETEKAQHAFLRAAEIARQLGASEQFAHAAIGFAGRTSAGQVGVVDETLVGLLEEALNMLAATDGALRARMMARLAQALAFSEDRDRSASVAQPQVLADVLWRTQVPLWTPDNVEERLAVATELLQLAERAGEIELVFGGHGWRLNTLREIGDVPEAEKELQAYAQLAHELRQPFYLYFTYILSAGRALWKGQFEEAEQLIQQALALGQAVPQIAPQFFGAQMLTLRWEQGRLGELEEAVKSLVEQHPTVPGWRAALAHLYSETGREADARREFEHTAASDFADLPRDVVWPLAVSNLSEVCAYLGDARRAVVLYDLLKPYAHRCVYSGSIFLGSVSRPLGRLAATMGQWEEAARHFDDALEMNTRAGSRPWVAHTQHDYAHMLVARGEPGDRDKALELLTYALDTAQELGMKALLDKASELKRRVVT
jgi:class 3 adenylate cyclase/tetratricopeptide (TPR) repeat protein